MNTLCCCGRPYKYRESDSSCAGRRSEKSGGVHCFGGLMEESIPPTQLKRFQSNETKIDMGLKSPKRRHKNDNRGRLDSASSSPETSPVDLKDL